MQEGGITGLKNWKFGRYRMRGSGGKGEKIRLVKKG